MDSVGAENHGDILRELRGLMREAVQSMPVRVVGFQVMLEEDQPVSLVALDSRGQMWIRPWSREDWHRGYWHPDGDPIPFDQGGA
jgi:hypothetical protein